MNRIVASPIAVAPKSDLAAPIARIVLLLTLAVCVVVPHSFQVATAALLGMSLILSLLVVRQSDWLQRLMTTYLLGVAITAFYIWLGTVHRAPRAASNQTIIVYIVAPFMWLMIGTVLYQQFGLERVTRILIRLTWAAIASVAAFFYLFLAFGVEAVRVLNENANVNVTEGFAGASILVYGSLIFLTGAVFAQPTMIKGRLARLILPGLLILCALTSGRSALILSVPIGALVGALLRGRIRKGHGEGQGLSVLLPTITLGVVGFAVLVVIDLFVDWFDLFVIFEIFYDELTSGGGSERTEQVGALWEGVQQSYGLGVGHGIGVPYLRSAEFPWRYEVIPMATLLRVGFIGTLVYMSTFIVYGLELARRSGGRLLRPEDVYMAGGFAAAAFAAFTNPYIESFVFQWMYFLPVLGLGVVANPGRGG
ncbi:hypothetical protein [Sphingomonas lenta]|uniref:O-antigen polymerase n=1 Tax=Sphingomonas lenta TaxID=1141887 RepID=A0A2A2SJ28_9SPHN|nr:hypothetical protein [Sphingomonas lenta]PAX09225.1 hypothetical protein CKY28_00175 [Sphingomonas lenta]